MQNTITQTNHGEREAVEVTIAGALYHLRFEFRETLFLENRFPGDSVLDLINDLAFVRVGADGLMELDDEGLPIQVTVGSHKAVHACLWACLRRTKPDITGEDVLDLIEAHTEAGGELSELAFAVQRAWFLGGAGQKALREHKKKVEARDKAKAESNLVSESGSDEPSSPPAAPG